MLGQITLYLSFRNYIWEPLLSEICWVILLIQYVWQARFNTFAFRIDHEFNQVVTIALYFWYEYLISLYLNTRSEHSQFSSVQFSFSKPKFFVLHRLIFYLLYIHEASCTYSMYTCDCTLYFGRSRENLSRPLFSFATHLVRKITLFIRNF